MKNQIEIYTTRDNEIAVEVRFDQETVWLNRNQLSLLFDRDIKTIGKHVNNVFKEGELDEKSVVANFATTASDGKGDFHPISSRPCRAYTTKSTRPAEKLAGRLLCAVRFRKII